MQVKGKELAFWNFGGYGEKGGGQPGNFRYFAGRKLNIFKRNRDNALRIDREFQKIIKKERKGRGERRPGRDGSGAGRVRRGRRRGGNCGEDRDTAFF